MKTKIIYISGGETFGMAQIRAAFDEVRTTLGLDSDTVLFGVPVDSDSAFAESESCNTTDAILENVSSVTSAPITAPAPADSIPEPADIIPTPTISQISTDTADIVTQEPKKKVRARKSVVAAEEPAAAAEEIIATESVVTDGSDKVIPILSILASKSEDVTTPTAEEPVAVVAEEVVSAPVDNVVSEPEEVTISDISLDAQLIAPVSDSAQDVEKITIGDMIEDVAPSAPVEKTLEQLLESMTPLREDRVSEEDTLSVPEDVTDEVHDFSDSDTDATLAQLASEFAQNEDKIVSNPKTESQGKIGKLKNILPFKKAKRDDSSLMGDLFGWAGIAANDEDFSMPGFFTPARKQGS